MGTKHSKDNQLQILELPCRVSQLRMQIWQQGVRTVHLDGTAEKLLYSSAMEAAKAVKLTMFGS